MKWTSVFEFCVAIAAWGQAAGGRRQAAGDWRLATRDSRQQRPRPASSAPAASRVSPLYPPPAACRLPPAVAHSTRSWPLCRWTCGPWPAILPNARYRRDAGVAL